MNEGEQDIEITTLKANYENMSKQIDKLDDTINDGFHRIENKIDSLDKKYARKDVENKLCDLEDKINKRNYDWLKYLATTLVSLILIAVGLYNKIK